MLCIRHLSFGRRRSYRLAVTLLISICLLFGCKKPDQTQPSGTGVMMEVATAQAVSLNDTLDTITGVYALGDHFLAVGNKNGILSAVQIGEDGVADEHPVCPEKPADATDRLFACGTDKDGSLMLVYECSGQTPDGRPVAVLAHYDHKGQVKDTVRLAGIDRPYQGVMHLSSGHYVLWDTDDIAACKGDQTDFAGPPPDGGYYLSFAEGENGLCYAIVKNGSMGIFTLDIQNATYGNTSYDRGFINANPLHISTGSGAVYANAGDFVYRYDTDEKKWKECFAWIAVALRGETLISMAELNPRLFACVFEDDNTVYIVKTQLREVDRKEVVIGALGDRHVQLDRLVALFNSRNKEYYATVKYYNEETILLAELVTDNAPDLLEISNVQIPLTPEKFEDIMPYLNQDDLIGPGDLVEGMLQSQMVNGQLTSLAASAWMLTLVAAEKDVGSEPGWTLEELKSVAANMEEGRRVFPEWMTSEQLLFWVSTAGLGQFIDWDTMQCNFDSEEFIELLEFCAEMPLLEDLSTYTSDFDEKNLLRIWPLQRLLLLENLHHNFSGEKYTLIGFPNAEGKTGSFFEPAEMEVMFAIPQRSGQKDGAWQVIREMILPEYQKTVTFLPINRHVMEAGIEELLQDRELHITREDVDKVMAVINQTDIYIHYHMQIYDMIVEEGMYYLYGEKSAEEVARLIQSRVSLYLDEHR